MDNGTAMMEVKWGKHVLRFSFFATVLRRSAVLASAISREGMFSLKCVKDHGLWWDAILSCSPCLCPLVMQQQAAGTEPLCTRTGTCHARATALGSCWLLPRLRWIWQALPVGYQRGNRRGRVGGDARKSSSVRYKTLCFSSFICLPLHIRSPLSSSPVIRS